MGADWEYFWMEVGLFSDETCWEVGLFLVPSLEPQAPFDNYVLYLNPATNIFHIALVTRMVSRRRRSIPTKEWQVQFPNAERVIMPGLAHQSQTSRGEMMPQFGQQPQYGLRDQPEATKSRADRSFFESLLGERTKRGPSSSHEERSLAVKRQPGYPSDVRPLPVHGASDLRMLDFLDLHHSSDCGSAQETLGELDLAIPHPVDKDQTVLHEFEVTRRPRQARADAPPYEYYLATQSGVTIIPIEPIQSRVTSLSTVISSRKASGTTTLWDKEPLSPLSSLTEDSEDQNEADKQPLHEDTVVPPRDIAVAGDASLQLLGDSDADKGQTDQQHLQDKGFVSECKTSVLEESFAHQLDLVEACRRAIFDSKVTPGHLQHSQPRTSSPTGITAVNNSLVEPVENQQTVKRSEIRAENLYYQQGDVARVRLPAAELFSFHRIIHDIDLVTALPPMSETIPDSVALFDTAEPTVCLPGQTSSEGAAQPKHDPEYDQHNIPQDKSQLPDLSDIDVAEVFGGSDNWADETEVEDELKGAIEDIATLPVERPILPVDAIDDFNGHFWNLWQAGDELGNAYSHGKDEQQVARKVIEIMKSEHGNTPTDLLQLVDDVNAWCHEIFKWCNRYGQPFREEEMNDVLNLAVANVEVSHTHSLASS